MMSTIQATWAQAGLDQLRATRPDEAGAQSTRQYSGSGSRAEYPRQRARTAPSLAALAATLLFGAPAVPASAGCLPPPPGWRVGGRATGMPSTSRPIKTTPFGLAVMGSRQE